MPSVRPLLPLLAVSACLLAPSVALAAPTATITTPEDLHAYTQGATLTADFACQNADTCTGTLAQGATIDTHTVGLGRSFTVTAGAIGQPDATVTSTYDVLPACTALPDTPVAYETAKTVGLDCTGPIDSIAITPPASPHGTLTSDLTDPSAPALTYTPDASAVGDDTFDLTVTESGVTSAVAHVTFQVSPCEDAAAPAVTAYPSPVQLDCPGTTAPIAIQGQPAHGTLTGDPATFTVQYVSEAGYTGTDTFTFGPAGAAPAAATLTVAAPPASSGGGGGGGGGGGSSDAGPFESGLVPDQDSAAAEPPPPPPPLASLVSRRNDNVTGTGTLDDGLRFGKSIRVTVSHSAVRASPSGRVSLRLTNANRFAVRARLTVLGAYRTTAAGKHRKRVARLRLTHAAFDLKAGRTVTLSLRLTRAQLALLRGLERTTMDAALRVTDAWGDTRTVTSRFALHATARRHAAAKEGSKPRGTP